MANSKFKIGDHVRIVKSVEVPAKNKFIGQCGVIIDILSCHTLRYQGHYKYRLDSGNTERYYWIDIELELVPESNLSIF